MTIIIRPLAASDSVDAVHVFFDAIHEGTKNVYSKEQRLAWAGSEPNIEGWQNRFDGIKGYVAELDGELIGFMTIELSGYIDLAFVKYLASGKGVGRRLYEAVEGYAQARQVEKLSTNASKQARPFFERMGWTTDLEQIVTTNGVELTNYKMSKSLGAIE